MLTLNLWFNRVAVLIQPNMVWLNLCNSRCWCILFFTELYLDFNLLFASISCADGSCFSARGGRFWTWQYQCQPEPGTRNKLECQRNTLYIVTRWTQRNRLRLGLESELFCITKTSHSEQEKSLEISLQKACYYDYLRYVG